MFRDVELLLQSVEDENYRHVNSRGVQGQAGNFSNDFRLSVRNNRSTLLRQAARLLAMDVPADVVSTFEMKARLTLMVERAFVKMRSKTPYPLSLEYSWQRAQIVEEEFKETNGVEGSASGLASAALACIIWAAAFRLLHSTSFAPRGSQRTRSTGRSG